MAAIGNVAEGPRATERSGSTERPGVRGARNHPASSEAGGPATPAADAAPFETVPGGCACSVQAGGDPTGSAGGGCACAAGGDAWASVADMIVTECVRVQPGEVVQLGGGIHAFALIEALSLAVRRAGAYPELNVTSQRLLNLIATETPLEYLATPPAHRLRWVEDVDAVIATDSLLDPDQLPALSKERREALAAGGAPVEEALAARGVRSLYVPFPSAYSAARYGLTPEALQARVLDSLAVDHEALSDRGFRLAERLAAATRLRVSGPGDTALTLRWKRPYLFVNDGLAAPDGAAEGRPFAELPGGVVLAMPEEVEVEGRWSVPLAYWERQRVEQLALRFRENRLEEADAHVGKAILRPLLFKGRRRSTVSVGRIAFGLNPRVTEPVGYSLLDLRTAGSVGLVLQDGRGEPFGAPAWEWPLVLPGASLWLDDEPVLERGRWLV